MTDRADVTGHSVVDVAVVGAGPAGLAAAVAAAEFGLRVAVVDAGQQPGGQYWRHPDETGSPGDLGADHHDRRVYTRLRRRFDAARDRGVLRYLPGRQVWFVAAPRDPCGDEGAEFVLHLNSVVDRPEAVTGPVRLGARRLILCPGGYDRQLPILGWDLPGVMAAGGVQALLKGHRTLAGRRAIVAGTGPFLLPVAVGLAEAGAEVVGICEAGRIGAWAGLLGGAVQVPSKGRYAVELAAELARHRVPYWTRSAVTEIGGRVEVDRVSVSRLDRDGRVDRTTPARHLDVDLVALGWGFTPSLELVTAVGAETRVDVDGSLVASVDDRQRSSVPGVYVAGEATGVGGALLAVLEGELAGATAALDAGTGPAHGRERSLHRAIRRSRAFARAMHLAHPVPTHWPEWVTPETVVCRCEEVDYGRIRQACTELGGEDARTVKLLARPGMGWCQGRVCSFATAALTAACGVPGEDEAGRQAMARRPLCAPVSLAELAATQGDGPTP